MKSLTMTIDMKPMPKKRPVVTKNGTFMPKDYVQWKEDVGWMMKSALNKAKLSKFYGRVGVNADFYEDHIIVTINEEMGDRWGLADIDNLMGAVMDAAQDAGIIDNDRDVIKMRGEFH